MSELTQVDNSTLLAFVTEQEEWVRKVRSTGPWIGGDGILRLCRIAREQAERIAQVEAERDAMREGWILASDVTTKTVKENCELRKRVEELETFRSTVAAVTPFKKDEDITRHATDIISNIEGRTYRKAFFEKTVPELRQRITELEADNAALSARESQFAEQEKELRESRGELAGKLLEQCKTIDALRVDLGAWMAANQNQSIYLGELQNRIAILEVEKNGAEERARLCLDAKNSAMDRLAALEQKVRELIQWIREGQNGVGHKIVSRPCSDQSCNGAVCGPVEAFWAKVDEVEALVKVGALDLSPSRPITPNDE